jgi:hypothetical protein
MVDEIFYRIVEKCFHIVEVKRRRFSGIFFPHRGSLPAVPRQEN